MRIPPEIVNAIVALFKHEEDLQIILDLLRASPRAFAPQICMNLHDPSQSVVLQPDGSYNLLSAILSISPDIAPHIYHLRISRGGLGSSRWLDVEERAMPALLDACVGLRRLCVDFGYGDYSRRQQASFCELPTSHQRALHEAMQRPTLQTLQMEHITFNVPFGSVMTLSLPAAPAHLSTLVLRRVALDRRTPGPVQYAQLSRPSSLEVLVCDGDGIQSLHVLYRAPRSCHFRNLRTVHYIWEGSRGDKRASDLFRANPHIPDLMLTAKSRYFLRPLDLSKNEGLRVLTLNFAEVEFGRADGIASLLSTIPSHCGLERLRLLDVSPKLEELSGGEASLWRDIDTALCRFDALRCVEVRLTESAQRPQVGEGSTVEEEEGMKADIASAVKALLHATAARNVLNLTYK
ncbi:hypothetical protein HDZ31DRAFT_35936 [Schizophyllum fasciatum]